MDGIKLTGTGAVAQTQAAVGAGTGAASQGRSSGAGLDALIVIALAAVFAAGADDRSTQAGAVVGIVAHDGVDGVSRLVTTGGAFESRGTVHDDGLGIVGTAGIAAAAAVGTGQALGDLCNTGILIHSHEFGGKHQNDAASQTQHHQYHDS